MYRLIGIGLLIGVGITIGVKAQQQAEKPLNTVKQWQMIRIGYGATYIPTDVNIIETKATCFYLFRAENNLAVTHIMKNDLPYGVGCQ